jgi:hypothetical protein
MVNLAIGSNEMAEVSRARCAICNERMAADEMVEFIDPGYYSTGHEECATDGGLEIRELKVDQTPTGPRYPEIEVQLTSHDGNAFAVLGAVQTALRDNAVDDEAVSEFMDEATADDYDHLLMTAMRWVNVS